MRSLVPLKSCEPFAQDDKMSSDGSTHATRYEKPATVMLNICACVCDAPEIEAALRQFFIENERVFPLYVQRLVTSSLAKSVFVSSKIWMGEWRYNVNNCKKKLSWF